MKLEIDVADLGRHETIDIAVKAFELSQTLREKWFSADYSAKRRILEITCLNWTLDGVSLVPTMRKPFDLLAKGLVSKDSRGDSRCTFVNEIAGVRLVLDLFPKILEFHGNAILKYVEPGLYSKKR